MKILFLIPARSGSKGLPDKNIRPLAGIPLIGRSLLTLKAVDLADHEAYFMVDTDAQAYADVGRAYGGSTPYLRPEALASDKSQIKDALRYALNHFAERGQFFDWLVLLQATSPLLASEDISQALKVLSEDGVTTVVSVVEAQVPPVWCNTLDETMAMDGFLSPEIRHKNRQDLPKYYHVCGAIRAGEVQALLETDFDWYQEGSKALVVPRERAIDIDSLEDFQYADFLLRRESE